MQVIDKTVLFKVLLVHLQEQLRSATRQQLDSQSAAFHEENKAEGSKDTRSTEASYLARGLAQRVVEMQYDLDLLKNLQLRVFTEDDPVAIAALLAVEDEDEHVTHYFIAPSAGGTKLVVDAGEVKIITPKSPLGRALIGQHLDDEIEFASPQGRKILTIVQIS